MFQGFNILTLCVAALSCVSAARDLKAAAPVPTPVFHTVDPSLSAAEVAEVFAVFKTWGDALKTKDPATVASLYSHNAVLVPTLSNDIRITRAQITDYFVDFLAKEPKVVIDEYNIRREELTDMGKPKAISFTGIYSFTFKDGSKVSARYSIMYMLMYGVWKIQMHHSSLLPSKLVPTPASGPAAAMVNTTDPGLSATETSGVLRAFLRWNDGLATKDPKRMIAFYTNDAILLPTLSDDVRTTQAERYDYFVGFLAKEPSGVIDEYDIRLEGLDQTGAPETVSMSGIYTFTFHHPPVSTARARFTYVYRKVGGQWLIRLHHSSQLPKL